MLHMVDFGLHGCKIVNMKNRNLLMNSNFEFVYVYVIIIILKL